MVENCGSSSADKMREPVKDSGLQMLMQSGSYGTGFVESGGGRFLMTLIRHGSSLLSIVELHQLTMQDYDFESLEVRLHERQLFEVMR